MYLFLIETDVDKDIKSIHQRLQLILESRDNNLFADKIMSMQINEVKAHFDKNELLEDCQSLKNATQNIIKRLIF